jgi:primosomal protein N' (replication factor Y)
VEQAFGSAVEIRGPSASPIEKVKDEYRFQVWYFCASATKVVPELVRLQKDFAWPDDITQVLDVDAMSLV